MKKLVTLSLFVLSISAMAKQKPKLFPHRCALDAGKHVRATVGTHEEGRQLIVRTAKRKEDAIYTVRELCKAYTKIAGHHTDEACYDEKNLHCGRRLSLMWEF